MRSWILLASALLVACFLAPAAGAEPAAAQGWEPVSEADGVRVWSRPVGDSAVLGFRGEATLEVPIGRLVGVLLDTRRSSDWVDRLVEARRLRELENGASVLYNRYALSWPLRDRDYVLKRVLVIDPEARVVTATYRSVEDPTQPEQDCCIRAVTDPTLWRFSQLRPGRTRVEVEVSTDPKGSIPLWLANAVQRGWPRNSILRLAARAGEPDAAVHPLLAQW